MKNDFKLATDGYLQPLNKLTGFMFLKVLSENNFPCVDVQALTQIETLPPKQLFTVRTAVVSGNDHYLPSILGATRSEIIRWRDKPIDLKPYSISVQPYTFGLQRFPVPEDRERNRYMPLKEIKDLQLFYHPYFIDTPPYGASGRIILRPPVHDFPRAIIEVIKPHLPGDRTREMKDMQFIVETTTIFAPSVHQPLIERRIVKGFEPLAKERIIEVLYNAELIQLFLTKEFCVDASRLILEWSYCINSPDIDSSPQNYNLLFWGLRAERPLQRVA